MLENFLRFVEEQNLFAKKDKILLAVSGGVDSMVMLELFRLSGYTFGVAHCNFKLRGEDADEDQRFVERTCETHKIPFHTVSFNTNEFAEQNKLSIQMAARELRYGWFEEIRNKNRYQYIATAHHKGDVVETFFINLARGTGIRGLTGIKAKVNNLVRPILFAKRKQIESFANENQLRYREDASNASLKYVRNKIRHDIIPSFEEMFQNYSDTLHENIERLKDIEQIYHNSILSQKQEVVSDEETRTVIDISKLKKLNPLNTYLFEFLRPYNFNNDTVSDIAASLDRPPGKQFYSATHRLIKDRNKLIIIPIDDDNVQEFTIGKNESYTFIRAGKADELALKISRIARVEDFRIPNSAHIAALDATKLSFPLKLRKWQKGDVFYPLGMPKRRKISDFFSDQKFSIDQKENTWILASKGKIVWIVAHRIDDRFKITDKTKEILLFEVQ